MLGGWGLPPLDLPALLQFGITALVLVCGLLFVLRNAASRYFVVDAGFEADHGSYVGRSEMSVGDEKCFVCGRRGTKKCARCKGVRYCSQECQARHWKDGHRQQCKEPKLSGGSLVGRTGGRRKTSSIALVPARGYCKVLEQPKKILFPYDEFVKLFHWEKHVFPPCGLLNCGNSCFANVVLQCLACTRPLVAYLLEGSHSKTCSWNDWCFLCELQIHIQKVSQTMKPFSPINILSRLPRIGGNLGNGRQEDAHEFMRFSIDMMQSVCLHEFGGEKALDLSAQETTLIQHIFGGHLQSQVKCTKCDKISNRYENMMDLIVEIQGDAESLEECLNQFTGKEWLDGENMYKCDGCDEYVKAWKRLTVHQSPNILTIALKRFQSGRFGKLNKRISFPVTLNLGPYMSGSGDGTDLYSLYAVVVHIDMLNASFFGHYICYTKDFYGNWYRIDDCRVVKVNIEEVLTQGAYMLFYSRINVRQPFIKDPDSSKTKDEQSAEMAPVSLGNFVSSEAMENGPERASIQRETQNLSLDMPAKSDVDTVVEEMDDVHLNLPQNMHLDELQEVILEESHKMELDESRQSDLCKAVVNDLNGMNPDHLSEQNPLSPKKFEAKTDNFLASVDYHITQENGPIRTSEEFFSVAEKPSITKFAPASYEMTEPLESNISGSRSDHVSPIDGSPDIENRAADLHHSFPLSGHQGNLESFSANSRDTDELEQLPSHCFSEKDFIVKGGMDIENRVGHFCGRSNCNQLECGYDNLNSKENLKPLFCPGFLDNHTQKKSQNDKPQMTRSELGLPDQNFAGTMQRAQLNGTTYGVHYSTNLCNGLLYEPEKVTFEGSLKLTFQPEFPSNHVQKVFPIGETEVENMEIGIPNKIPTENCQVASHWSTNGFCNGLLHESEGSSSGRQSKPLFSRGFLDHHAEKGLLKGKVRKPSSGALLRKGNGNCTSASYPQAMQHNGDDFVSNKPLH